MRAIEEAKAWADANKADLPGLLRHCVRSGWVVIEPELVLLAEERRDSWFVFVLVGDVRLAMSMAPNLKEWVEWERIAKDGSVRAVKVRWRDMHRLARR
jgi:hypothetical protein